MNSNDDLAVTLVPVREHPREPLEDQEAIRQAGERVVRRLLGEPLLRPGVRAQRAEHPQDRGRR